MKRHAHVDLGERLNDLTGRMRNIGSVRENQQLVYEVESERGLELERQVCVLSLGLMKLFQKFNEFESCR